MVADQEAASRPLSACQQRIADGLAFAVRYREGAPRAATGGFPYPGHRTCAEWQ